MSKETRIIGFIAVLITILWLGCWFTLEGKADHGTLGYMFEAINSLYPGFVFLCVIYVILLKRLPPSLRHKELELTCEELRKAVEAQGKSEIFLDKQSIVLEKTQQFSAPSVSNDSYKIHIARKDISRQANIKSIIKLTKYTYPIKFMTNELCAK
ncbi:hypothetical protein ACQKP8_03270 [Photobacterium alginatilyticum]|uniref:hypothetical protein n=1 Tax=Photobacterium alginatilyticum TaxID=1775171 RepID=UPI0040684B7C